MMFRRKKARPHIPIPRRNNHNHIPEDIVFDVLSRLPVKSLLRFSCVCKSWSSLIHSRSFISTHLNMSSCRVDNDHDHGYVMHMPRSSVENTQLCTVTCDRTFDCISEFRAPFIRYTYVVGSCNGLLCLYYYWNFNYNVHFWNPSIRKFKSLPTASIILSNTLSLGFAYDSQNNDYKLVKVEWPIEPSPTLLPLPPPEFEVYSLSSDSWRKVEFGISWRPNIWYYSINYDSPFPFVSGHLHFMVGTIRETGQQEMHPCEMILSFDVNSEKIGELPVPDDDSFQGDSSYGKRLTLFKGKLALIKEHSFRLCGYGHSVWVMMDYGACKSWNKLFSVTIEGPNVSGTSSLALIPIDVFD
uniref:F-box domain-containing protein n=1 Tax=Quercus lobata TaxID=97700 RepID=A0A7N2LHT3_QUELO